MKKVKYIIDQNVSEDERQELFDSLSQKFGNKALIRNGSIEVSPSDENRIVEFLTYSGLKYKKAA